MKKTSPRRSRKRSSTSALSAELTLAITAALEKKALDVVVLDLRKASAFTDFFVICTGTSTRQVSAIAEAVEAALAARGARPALVEGRERSAWVLIDYFDFIVHIFTPATREFYGLERLWADAERVEVSAQPVRAAR
jgi:ribosome-associated protein